MEVDFVLTLGLKRVPIEVKYQPRISPSEFAAAEAFCAKPHYGASFGLIVTRDHADRMGSTTVAVTAPALLLAV